MKLYPKDINRIKASLAVHQQSIEVRAGNQLFTMTVIDDNNTPLGTIQTDENKKSYFKPIGQR
jgi:hypothetical protein